MARISLLLCLASALGSLFISVSSHALHAPIEKSLFPKTVSELQTLPFTKITEILIQKEKFAPKTTKFNEMFTLCKDYVAYLESLYKFENPIVDVLGIARTRYALMTKAIIATKDSVSGKLDRKTSRKLKKSTANLIKGFLQIKDTIVKISAKHNYKPDAKLTFRESACIGDALLKFKVSINGFMDIFYDLEEKKTKKVGHQARSLGEDDDVERNAFERFFKKFSDKYGGYLGGKTHGRELTEVKPQYNSYVDGFETIYEKFSEFFGGYLGGNNPHGRELIEAQAGEVKGLVRSRFEKLYGSVFGIKSHGRDLAEDKGKSSIDDFVSNIGLGRKAQFDAAGKMKVAGEAGFRSLNRPYKHPISTEA